MPFFSLNQSLWCLIWIFDEFVVRLQSPENQDPQGLLKECLLPFLAISFGLKCFKKARLKLIKVKTYKEHVQQHFDDFEFEERLQVANGASMFPVGHFRHFVVSLSSVRNCRIWGNRFVKQ